MRHLYKPLYRPAAFSGIPKGWQYVEAPPDLAHRRPELPMSTWIHGIISYAEPLTKDQCRSFELEFIGESYTLSFHGAALADYFPAYEREHASIKAAEAEADRVRKVLKQTESSRHSRLNTDSCIALHPGMIHGPGLGDMGSRVW